MTSIFSCSVCEVGVKARKIFQCRRVSTGLVEFLDGAEEVLSAWSPAGVVDIKNRIIAGGHLGGGFLLI